MQTRARAGLKTLASRSTISSPYHRATQDLQPPPGTLLPTLQRLVQRSTNISLALSLRQEPKSSHINNLHQQSKPSNARFLSPQQQPQELEPATKRQQYSTCRWIVNCRWTSSMRIDSCRWIVNCRWTSSMRIDSCRWIVSCR